MTAARSAAALVAALAGFAAMDFAAAQSKPACEATAPGYDSHEIKCAVSASGTAQRYRFRANFSGSHDDTSASMAVTLDGGPLACEKGSKTELMGEDGEVSLECRFSIAERSQHGLGVRVTWRHAQYKDFELRTD